MDILLSYPWPGNVRQLDNAIEHAFVKCGDSEIAIKHIPEEIVDEASPSRAKTQRDDIVKALERTDGNKAKAARFLGISRKTLYQKIKLYNI